MAEISNGQKQQKNKISIESLICYITLILDKSRDRLLAATINIHLRC